MRLAGNEIKDAAEIQDLLDRGEWGTLGLVTAEGLPCLVPLNYLHLDGKLYFHSARSGEKMDILRVRGAAAFLVVEPGAQVPSYLVDPVQACRAAQYFRSVILRGPVRELEDSGRKADVLQALMRKLQPEGRHEPIDALSPTYRDALAGVAVLEMTIASVTAKEQLGQHLTPDQRARVVDHLERRGRPEDLRTAERMRRDFSRTR
jgi:hypothetical protein